MGMSSCGPEIKAKSTSTMFAFGSYTLGKTHNADWMKSRMYRVFAL